MASWAQYIENLEKTNNVNQSAIIGKDGVVWAATTGLTLSTEEIKKISAGFAQSHILESEGAFRLAGENYYLIRIDNSDRIIGRKTGGGCSVCATKTAMVFGIYKDPIQPGQCNFEIEKVARFLKEQNY